jgi:hypothetical protein
MKFLLVFLLLLNVCYSSSFNYCSPELAKASQTTLNLPEASLLLEQIQKEGGVGLFYDKKNANIYACWNPDTRTIHVASTHHRTFGTFISSILFEMHNAKQNRRFEHLFYLAETGKITRSKYIEAMERIEHQNGLETMALINKGISLGIYPKDAQWEIPTQFHEYFQIQIEMGHSAHHGKVFDQISRIRKA